MVKVDYLEKYCREAIKRGHALAPQSSFGSNTFNMMYLARVPWDGLMPNDVFLRYFGERYYGDKRMGQALIDYQNALKNHRSWRNNIHTRKIAGKN